MVTMMRKAYAKVSVSLNNQKGAQAIEWIALAGVVIAVFAAIQTVFKSDTEVGTAVSTTLSNIIKSLSGK